MLDPNVPKETRDTKCLIVLAHVNYRLRLHANRHYVNTMLILHFLLVLLLCSVCSKKIAVSNERLDLEADYLSLYNFNEDPYVFAMVRSSMSAWCLAAWVKVSGNMFSNVG